MANNEKLDEVMKKHGLSKITTAETDGKVPKEAEGCKRLMDVYYTLKNTADMEFPYWYNRVWWENDGELPVVRRAKAMAAALAHSTPTIQPYEKLVMNKTKNIRGAFPYPWISASFFNAQAEALMNKADAPKETEADFVSVVGDGGGNVIRSYGAIISLAKKFGMRKEEIPVLVKVCKPWKGISVEDLSAKYWEMIPDHELYQNLLDSVVCMFDSWAIPQGREVINYYFPLQYGFDGIIKLCDKRMKELMGVSDGDGILGTERAYFYVAIKEVVKGLSKWCENYAERASYLASVETDEALKNNYLEIVEIMNHIAHQAPSTFREALQLTLCCHLAVVNEDPQSGQSIGRLGQVLNPFYEKDLREGRVTEEEVIELLEYYRIKITCIECFASAGVTGGVLSGNTFNNLSMGGLGFDGRTAVTPLEYLIVEAAMRCKTTQPTLSVLYDEKTPEEFLMKCALATKMGMGFPAYMNNQEGVNFMMRQFASEGMNLEDARAWCLGGCLESSPGCFMPLDYDGKVTMIPGGAGPTAGTGVHFIALPKVLELVLTNGKDERTGRQVLPPHNHALTTYEEVYRQWKNYISLITETAIRVNNVEMDIWRKTCMPVVASMLKPDCLTKGQHIGNMGSRYNGTINFESCGTITWVNSMASLKKNVYDDQKYTLDEMKDALLHNFGYESAFETGVYSPNVRKTAGEAKNYASIFADCINAPKYGNSDSYADSILKDYEYWITKELKNYQSYYGKPLYLCQISVSTHGPQGAITLATADSRLAGTTYSDGSVSAVAGTDKNGIYAIFDSATVYDHSISQNSQMNLKIHPSAVKGQNGTRKLLDLIRAYMRKGGFHVQFNIVDSRTLKSAQEKPENYRDLMVRVAGFTQYWCEIGKPIQDEVIYRTEYEEV